MSENTPRVVERLGFIGPLTEVDQDRCPLCGLDPLDDTLHAPWCRTVTENLCGVIEVGSICLRPEHLPVRQPGEAWTPWVGHEWIDLEDAR